MHSPPVPQSTLQVPVHSTSHREYPSQVMTLPLPARTPQRSMFRQSKWHRSPHRAPQAVASWHVTSQSSPQLVLHSITLLHCVLQSFSQTVPQ